MKQRKNINPSPEKGVLLILRVGTILQSSLVLVYLINTILSHQKIGAELSGIITLTICLIPCGILVFRPKESSKYNRNYFPMVIGLQTLISLELPLLFTSQADITEFFIAFWLVIPFTFIPLAIVGLQYTFLTIFIYSLFTNLFDLLLMVHIQFMSTKDFPYSINLLKEYRVYQNIFLRFILMVMIGHILSVLVQSIRNNASQLAQANDELEELNRHLEDRVLERTQTMEATNQKTLEGWVRLMELRHLEPTGHTERMLKHGHAFGKKLKLDAHQIEILKDTILLHDVGKLGIPDQILLKPGSLTEQEFSRSKLHVEYGIQILSGIDFLQASVEVIAAHHEHWNGSGYPKGLREKDIPFLARVFSVIEVYDVLTHDTVYRKAWTKTQAKKHLLDNSGILFDPLVVTQFMGLLETQELDHIAESI